MTPLQQQAVEAVRAWDEALNADWRSSISFTEAERRRDRACTASIAAIRELADNEGET